MPSQGGGGGAAHNLVSSAFGGGAVVIRAQGGITISTGAAAHRTWRRSLHRLPQRRVGRRWRRCDRARLAGRHHQQRHDRRQRRNRRERRRRWQLRRRWRWWRRHPRPGAQCRRRRRGTAGQRRRRRCEHRKCRQRRRVRRRRIRRQWRTGRRVFPGSGLARDRRRRGTGHPNGDRPGDDLRLSQSAFPPHPSSARPHPYPDLAAELQARDNRLRPQISE